MNRALVTRIGIAMSLWALSPALSQAQIRAVQTAAGTEAVDAVMNVEPVWSGHSVGFCLVTHGNNQYVAYYDANRQMTVAQRKLDANAWTFKKLPTSVVWDSHNYVTMAVDSAGNLHVSGNMHCVPLVYFRTTVPGDVRTLVLVPNMVGPDREKRTTYPRFLQGPRGEFLFKYRDGRSGQGDEIYNVYDVKSATWRRLLDKPLTTSTEGKGNAYFAGPLLGEDGYYHLAWVWRDSGDCATNHDLSYARSKDLVHWTSSAGKEYQLPITRSSVEIVDPTPAGKGLLNSCVSLGFDSKSRPVISYHKYDSVGNSQIYVARFDGGKWAIQQVSDWKDYRWEFSGGGTIEGEISVGRVTPSPEGLTLSASSKVFRGTWLLDETTLKPVGMARGKPMAKGLSALMKVQSNFEGMAKRAIADAGTAPAGERYMLIWETLGPNRDRPRTPPLPQPSMLQVVRIRPQMTATQPVANSHK